MNCVDRFGNLITFYSFYQTKLKNRKTRLLVEIPFSGDWLIESPIILEAYICYIMMIQKNNIINMFHFIFIYDRFDYGLFFIWYTLIMV